MCVFSVSIYYEGILFLKLTPIYQKDIYYFLVVMKQQKCAGGSSDVEKSVVGYFYNIYYFLVLMKQQKYCTSILI